MNYLTGALTGAGGVLPPFIVVLDMHMPRMNGVEFLEAVADSPGLEALVIFAFVQDGPLAGHGAEHHGRITARICKDAPLSSLEAALTKAEVGGQLLALDTGPDPMSQTRAELYLSDRKHAEAACRLS